MSLQEVDFAFLGFCNRSAEVVTDPDLLPLATRIGINGGLAASIREHTMKTEDDTKAFVLWSIPCRRDAGDIERGNLKFEHFVDPPAQPETVSQGGG